MKNVKELDCPNHHQGRGIQSLTDMNSFIDKR